MMENKLALWQRCEALGPMELDGVRLVLSPLPKTELSPFNVYHITIDKRWITEIRNGYPNKHDWLTDMILKRFECSNIEQ